jgi:hypothetical protein
MVIQSLCGTSTLERSIAEVVDYMKQHGFDLREYLARNWLAIGEQLVGKLHLYCGDEDGGYFNLAVYLLDDFLRNTEDPHYGSTFAYGRPLKGHSGNPLRTPSLSS